MPSVRNVEVKGSGFFCWGKVEMEFSSMGKKCTSCTGFLFVTAISPDSSSLNLCDIVYSVEEIQ